MDVFPVPTFENIIPRLIGYVDRLLSYEVSADVSPHLAFNTIRSDSLKYYLNNYRGRGNSYGRFNNNRCRGSFSTRGRDFHQQISSSPGSSISSSKENILVCQICGKIGHPALKCWHRFNNIYQYKEMPSALTAMRITDITDHIRQEWHPDTGASAHITNSPSHLQQSQPYISSDSVMVSDGYYFPITHTWSLSLASTSGKLPLKYVLVCPTIEKSLLSVSKLTKDFPYLNLTVMM